MGKTSFVIGKGSQVDFALLPVGSRVEPTPATLTIGSSAVAKDTTAPATVTITTALPSGVVIPAGSYLGFVAPTTGKTVVVQLATDAEAGDTDLDVVSIPEAIAASSVAKYPLRLSGRTAANIGRTGNRISAVDFDSDGYEDGLTASIAATVELPGNWLPSDAGFSTAEYAFEKLRESYIWVTLPKSSTAYSKGRVYKGACSITALPLAVPANGIITGNITIAVNGVLERVDEVPT